MEVLPGSAHDVPDVPDVPDVETEAIDAAFHGSLDALATLHARGMSDECLGFALEWAVLGCQPDALRMLLEWGVGAERASGALAVAARWEARDMCDALLAHGASWTVALRHVANESVVLDEHDFDAIVDFSGVDARDALRDAAGAGDVKTCRELVRKLGTSTVAAAAEAIRRGRDVDTCKYLVTNIRPEKNRKLRYLVKLAVESKHDDALTMLLTDVYRKDRVEEARRYADSLVCDVTTAVRNLAL